MAKFNKGRKGLTKTVNYMNAPAYTLQDEAKLLNLVATCMVNEPKYYGDVGKVEQEIFDLCSKIRSEYILQLANYARNELYLRSVSIYLLAIASYLNDTKRYVRKYAPLIIKRADELNEVLAAYVNIFGKPIPNCLKKGVADSFTNFDEYQFGKYNKKSQEFTFRHTSLLTHPAAYNKSAMNIVKKILDDKLPTPYTWETELSDKGNTGPVWDDLINSRKLPYMATIRNLRNMVKVGITEVDKVINYITNEKAIARSRQLPFRYLSAYDALSGKGPNREPRNTIKFEKDDGSHFMPSSSSVVEKFKSALDIAIMKSADLNIPKISGKTMIICDNSGSARGDYGGASKISMKSVRTMADTGNLLGLLTWYSSENTYFAVFGDRLIEVRPDRTKGILENFEKVDKAGGGVGGGTEQGVFTCLKNMIRDRVFTDRLIVCSDLQIGDGNDEEYGIGYNYGNIPDLVKKYRKTVNPNFMYYSVCFNGYGTDVVVGDKKVLISGWSDNILKFIQEIERDSQAQIKYIKDNYGGPPVRKPTYKAQCAMMPNKVCTSCKSEHLVHGNEQICPNCGNRSLKRLW